MNLNISKKILLGSCGIMMMFTALTVDSPGVKAAYPVTVVADVSVTSLKRTVDLSAMHFQESVLNGLAWSAAKIMLQNITASVVTWINTGFKGNPAFLSNPEGFFIDSADQLTGAFIANTGVLQDLCAPFNVDIRLALAMNMAPAYRTRYACTLGTVINNAKNSRTTISGNATLNGRTIGGAGATIGGGNVSVSGSAGMTTFMNDFSQGGWPAFIAMTTEPQNNIYGAYFIAQSDLQKQIATRRNSVRVDLNMGRGFMSWKDCKPVSVEEGETRMAAGNDSNLEVKVDKEGYLQYEECTTKTPGSVIAGSLDKSLGSSVDTLNLADSLNEIVGALFSQLINKVLQGGLLSASGPTTYTNVTGGIATQLTNQSSVSNSYYLASQYAEIRKQIIELLDNADKAYSGADTCYVQMASVSGAAVQDKLTTIRQARSTLSNVINTARTNSAEAYLRLSKIKELYDLSNSATTASQIQQVNTRFSELSRSGSNSLVTNADIQNANMDYTSAQTIYASATRSMQECTGI